MMTLMRTLLAAALLVPTIACTELPTAPEPVATASYVPTATVLSGRMTNDRNINVDPASGMIPCDWDAVPTCGPNGFASCVQHGIGTGKPGPMAHWQWSEWQCFPTSYLPR